MIADDSVFLTLMVACLSKTTLVLSLFPGIREKGTKYLQAVSHVNGICMDSIKVIEKRKSCLTIQDTFEKKVIDLLAYFAFLSPLSYNDACFIGKCNYIYFSVRF